MLAKCPGYTRDPRILEQEKRVRLCVRGKDGPYSRVAER